MPIPEPTSVLMDWLNTIFTGGLLVTVLTIVWKASAFTKWVKMRVEQLGLDFIRFVQPSLLDRTVSSKFDNHAYVSWGILPFLEHFPDIAG